MIMFVIFSIGCFFGAALFNINVGWGDQNAKIIRNTLSITGGVLLIIPIIYAIFTNTSDVGLTLIICCLPLAFIGLFLCFVAILKRKSSGEKIFNDALNAAMTLEAIALVSAIIGAIIIIKGGAV